MRFCKYLFLAILFANNLFADTNKSVVFTEQDKLIYFGKSIGILNDSLNKLTFDDVKSRTDFYYKSESTPNLGISNDAYWITFAIKNESSNARLLLRLEYPIIDEIDFYTPNKLGGYSKTTSGEQAGFANREIDNQNFLYYLEIPTGSTRTYFMRIKSGEQIQLPLTVGVPKYIFEELITKDLFFGLYIGIIIVMAIYNLFIYITVRDKSYLYYVSYIVFVGLTQVALGGYGFKYLWPNNIWLVTQSTFLIPVLNGWAAIIFVKNFLNTKKNYLLGDRILNIVFVFYGFCFLLSLLGQFYYAQNLVQLTAMLGSLFCIYIAYKISLQGYRPAKFFLVAWSIFLVSVVIFALRNFNILPYNNLTYYALQIGSALEVTLLSFALADKINFYRKEKEASQAEVLRIALENERIIREQNAYLEEKVTERTKKLHAANLELSKALDDLKNAQTQLVDAEKMASLGQLTAGIAHEINNPINFVSSNIRPLKRDIEDILLIIDKFDSLIITEEDKLKFKGIYDLKKELDYDYLTHEIDVLLKGIADGANRTVEIVKGLKSFSRLDESDLKFANVNEGIESTLIILNSTFRGKVLIVKELGLVPEIECFAGKLNQVFMNIINNAAQAVLAHHGNSEDGKVVISTTQENNRVFIRIKDNGTGMSEEVKNKIFEPFFTTKKAGEGTGLGLSIVYSIIELHRGDIKVESEIGKGTEFIISLPLTQD